MTHGQKKLNKKSGVTGIKASNDNYMQLLEFFFVISYLDFTFFLYLKSTFCTSENYK